MLSLLFSSAPLRLRGQSHDLTVDQLADKFDDADPDEVEAWGEGDKTPTFLFKPHRMRQASD